MRYVKCALDLEKDVIIGILNRSDELVSLKSIDNNAYSVDNFGQSIVRFTNEREMILDLEYVVPIYVKNHKDMILEHYTTAKNMYDQYIRLQKFGNIINNQD